MRLLGSLLAVALALWAGLWAPPPAGAADLPKPLVSGLKNPESVCVGPDGRVYVSVVGELDKEGDGGIVVIDKGKAVPFVEGLDDPKGLVAFQQSLFVADRTKVYVIDRDGKKTVLADTKAFD